MRYLLAPTILAALCMTGCDNDRQTYSVVPDRQGHATAPDNATQGRGIGNQPVAGAGEMYYTLEANDTLSSVARKFNVSLDYLIRRNDIRRAGQVKPGTQLIVPRVQTAPSRAHPEASQRAGM